MARLSRFVWTSIKVSIGGTILVIICYAGWTIITTLAPSGASANAIMRKASDILKHDSEMALYFGDVKTYGEDFGGSREGRRYFVPDYEYTDDLTDVKYRRVRFNLEGDRNRKATVWAELRAGSSDFRYLIVLTKDKSRVWSIIDNRPPERTLDERQAAVTTLLQDAGWSFWADSEADVAEQAAQLGDYWLKVKTVRGDMDRDRCEREGMTSRPAWTMGPAESPGWLASLGNGISELTGVARGASPAAGVAHPEQTWRVSKGVKTLRELEVMTKELRKRQAGAQGADDDGILATIRRAVGLA